MDAAFGDAAVFVGRFCPCAAQCSILFLFLFFIFILLFFYLEHA
jgi:hypothetical protein